MNQTLPLPIYNYSDTTEKEHYYSKTYIILYFWILMIILIILVFIIIRIKKLTPKRFIYFQKPFP